MAAERALVDVDARDAVACVAVSARTVERAGEVGAGRQCVAGVRVRGALVNLEARVGRRIVAAAARARALRQMRAGGGAPAARAVGGARTGALGTRTCSGFGLGLGLGVGSGLGLGFGFGLTLGQGLR